jgi:hypothetical protein
MEYDVYDPESRYFIRRYRESAKEKVWVLTKSDATAHYNCLSHCLIRVALCVLTLNDLLCRRNGRVALRGCHLRKNPLGPRGNVPKLHLERLVLRLVVNTQNDFCDEGQRLLHRARCKLRLLDLSLCSARALANRSTKITLRKGVGGEVGGGGRGAG